MTGVCQKLSASRRYFPCFHNFLCYKYKYHVSPASVRRFHCHGSTSYRMTSNMQERNTRSFNSLCINNKNIRQVTAADRDDFLSGYDTIMLDCDGVLWEIDHVTPLPGIAQAMKELRERGKQILFVTNNSIPGRATFVEKFQQYGFEGAFEEVFSVSFAAAVYLKNVAKIQRSVYAIGTNGMESELKQMGLKYYGFGPETDKPTRNNEELMKMKFYDDVDAVLVGFDEYFDYIKLYKAASYLTNLSCHYVATNSLEGSVLIGPNRRQPITASMVKAVTVASKREPIVVGKPDLQLYKCIEAMFPDIDKSRALFVGDSIKADIGFAKAAGIDSALVLTGAATLATVQDNPGLEPDFVFDSLAVLGQS